MAKSASLFPHFIRIFSAGTLWGSLLVVIALNVYAKTTLLSEPFSFMVAVMASPESGTPHELLAQKLWSLGFLTGAERELTIAETSGSNVLGTTTAQDLKTQWEQEPEKLKESYEYWQSVVSDRPDYRAGLVYTASLAYQLARFDEGKTYIAKASSLDPNNALVRELAFLLGK